MRLITNTHVALLRFNTGTLWYCAKGTDDALVGVCKEFRRAIAADRNIDRHALKDRVFDRVYVYTVPPGSFLYWDDHGSFIVDEDSRRVTGAASVAMVYDNVHNRRPLSTCRINAKEADRVNSRAAEATLRGLPPIGSVLVEPIVQ